MSAHPQPGIHPDAESLNAFAEQALGRGEREQLLAHLAVCNRCREVVALAQEASTPETAAQVSAPAHAAQQSVPWFRNRWIAWGPALALAGIVTVAVVMHVRRADQGTESANAPQPSQQQATPQLQAEIDKPASPLGAPPSPAAKGKTQAQPRERALQTLLPPPPPPSPETIATAAFSSQPATVQPIPRGGVTHGSMAETVTVSPAPPALQPEVSFGANESAARGQQETAPKPSTRQTMAMNESQPWTAQAAPAAKAINRKAAAAPAFAPVTGGQLAAGIYTAGAEHIAALPSGLPAVSTVAGSDRVLALDKAGALFLSEDGGLHWQPITRQWTGHAVNVRLKPEPATQQPMDAAEEQGGGTSPGPRPGPVFEISNEKNQVWASSDGKTWSPE